MLGQAYRRSARRIKPPTIDCMKNKKRPFDVGTSYFPRRASSEYHRIGAVSLLCSEWEEVGHARIKHRHQKAVSEPHPRFTNVFFQYVDQNQWSFAFRVLGSSRRPRRRPRGRCARSSARHRSTKHGRQSEVSIGMVGGIISTPWLNASPRLHLEPINVVVYHEITRT